MFDEVDGSTSVQRSTTNGSDPIESETQSAVPEVNCGSETTDSRGVNSTVATATGSSSVTISTVSTGAFVPYAKTDLMDSKGAKLNIYDLLK
jgi:hypothetical protein